MKPTKAPGAVSKHGSAAIQFSLPGLILFSMALVFAAGITAYFLSGPRAASVGLGELMPTITAKATTDMPPKEMPAWGELVTDDMLLERPEEYIAKEVQSFKAPRWVFEGVDPSQVPALLGRCGLNAHQVEQAQRMQTDGGSLGPVIRPDDDLIFSLSPEVRARLYNELARSPQNHYMANPWCYPGKSFDEVALQSGLKAATISEVRKLLYPRGEALCFSDLEAVLQHLPTELERIQLVKVLSREPAVLAKLRIRPDTDVDKLLGYWGMAPGVRLKDMRPLLEALKRRKDGGSISLLYLLPQFARERLYLFPMPAQTGDAVMDCHWSSLNFFNEKPDNRLGDPSFAGPFITTNYYEVANPSMYGDLILVLNESGSAIHSAVYLADDIVFTKNGDNYLQPWMLMRLKSMAATYSPAVPPRITTYRNRAL